MRKSYLLFAGVASVLFSCKKDYSCSCTYTETTVNNTTGQTISSSQSTTPNAYIINGTKGKAKEKCGAYSYTTNYTYVDYYTGNSYMYTYTQTCTI